MYAICYFFSTSIIWISLEKFWVCEKERIGGRHLMDLKIGVIHIQNWILYEGVMMAQENDISEYIRGPWLKTITIINSLTISSINMREGENPFYCYSHSVLLTHIKIYYLYLWLQILSFSIACARIARYTRRTYNLSLLMVSFSPGEYTLYINIMFSNISVAFFTVCFNF